MDSQSVTTVTTVAIAATAIIAFWRKVLLILSAIAVAVFLFGIVYLATLLNV